MKILISFEYGFWIIIIFASIYATRCIIMYYDYYDLSFQYDCYDITFCETLLKSLSINQNNTKIQNQSLYLNQCNNSNQAT